MPQPDCPDSQELVNATAWARGTCKPATTTTTTTTTTAPPTTTATAAITKAANATTIAAQAPTQTVNATFTAPPAPAGGVVTTTGNATVATVPENAAASTSAAPGDANASSNDSTTAANATGGNNGTDAAGSAGGATGKTAAGADAPPWPAYPGCSAEQAAPLWGLGCGTCEAGRNTNGEQADASEAALCSKCLPSCNVAVLGAESTAGIAAFHKFPDRCECHGMRSLGEVHDAAHCCTPYVCAGPNVCLVPLQ